MRIRERKAAEKAAQEWHSYEWERQEAEEAGDCEGCQIPEEEVKDDKM